jgi:hypothetical protein
VRSIAGRGNGRFRSPPPAAPPPAPPTAARGPVGFSQRGLALRRLVAVRSCRPYGVVRLGFIVGRRA